MSAFPPPEAPAAPFGHRDNGAVADPLDEDAFDAFFEAQAKPGLQAMEGERVAAVGRFWKQARTGGVITLVACVVCGLVFGGRLIIFPLFALVAYLGLVAYPPLKRLGDEAKVRLLTTIAGALGFAYQIGGFDPPAYERLRGMGLLPSSDDQTFDDLFSGQRSGAAFAVCDAKLTEEQGSGKSRHTVTVFEGQMLSIRFPKKFLGVTVIARDSGLLNMFHKPAGMERVGLGASQFEREFEVYSTDQVEARFLVHPAFMEKLLDMESAFQGCKLRGIFCDGDLLIAVEGKDRFKFGDAFKPFDDLDAARDVASDLEHVVRVIDFILAGPPRAPELAPQSQA